MKESWQNGGAGKKPNAASISQYPISSKLGSEVRSRLTLSIGMTIIFHEIQRPFKVNPMPIFEFRCAECSHIFEKLTFNSDEEVDMSCPVCNCALVERVVSTTNYSIGAGPGANQPKITTKSCGGENQCMTLELPGHSK
jgi:putative FmdB family regulatory protein